MILFFFSFSLRDHEKECEYAPVRCPNSSKCPVVLKKVSTTLSLSCHTITDNFLHVCLSLSFALSVRIWGTIC